GRGRDASAAGGKDRASAGKCDPARASEMKPVEADLKEEIEHHLAAADGDGAALGQEPRRRLFPSDAARVPPPAVRAAFEPRRLARYDKPQGPVDVGIELMAAPREHHKVRKLLRPLVKLPVLVIAQRRRREAVGAGDSVVVGDDGVAGDVVAPWHVGVSPELGSA